MIVKEDNMMRNPYRIQEICQRLATAWERVPDLRLAQLLEDAEVGFYTEDDRMIQMVESFVDRYAPKEG